MTEPLPYVARLVIGHLLDRDEVTDIVGQEIVTDLTQPVPAAWVRVTEVGGRVVSAGTVYWLADTTVQIDCCGGPGGRAVAHDLAELCRIALHELSGSVTFTVGPSTVSGVVTGTTVGAIVPRSDESFKPPRPYASFDAQVAAHPLNGS